MRVRICGVVLLCLLFAGSAVAQEPVDAKDAFSRKNTWTVFAEYSKDSTPILMGYSRQRKLVDAGGGYSRRVVRFLGSDLSYLVEVRPVLFESDPLTIVNSSGTITYPTGPVAYSSTSSEVDAGKCQAQSGSTTLPTDPGFPSGTINYVITCERQWTFGQAFSPLGFKYSMRTRHRVQPFVIGTLGYMYTSRPVPVADAEAFNFVFDFGAGVEVFRSDKRSIALECRYHHLSNKGTAEVNPGVDNLMFKASYSFGR